jgi:hypothetical protein
MSTREQLRDEGIGRAVDHADRVEPKWSEQAFAFLDGYARQHKQFTGEDVREAAEEFGLSIPPDKRAWGGVMQRASRKKIIRRIGFTTASDPKVHCNVVTQWESNIS